MISCSSALIEKNLLFVADEINRQEEVSEYFPPEFMGFKETMNEIYDFINIGGEYALAYEYIIGLLDNFSFVLSSKACIKTLDAALTLGFKSDREDDDIFRISENAKDFMFDDIQPLIKNNFQFILTDILSTKNVALLTQYCADNSFLESIKKSIDANLWIKSYDDIVKVFNNVPLIISGKACVKLVEIGLILGCAPADLYCGQQI